MKKHTLGYLEGGVSAVGNTVLFAAKLWAGITFSSVAILADAWHTLSDTFTSLVIIAGFWVASRPADRRHPFGHGRAESVAAIVVGTLLCVVALDLGVESVRRIHDTRAANFTGTALAVCLASAGVKEAMALFAFWAARRTGTASLRAEGWHHRTDAVTSLLVVGGGMLGGAIWWIDGLMGLLIAGLILYTAVDVLRASSSPLLGEAPAKQDEEAIRAATRASVPRDVNVHHIHVHRYGDHVEVTLHIRLPPDTPLNRSHAMASSVEATIRRKTGMEATVHTEPDTPPGTAQGAHNHKDTSYDTGG